MIAATLTYSRRHTRIAIAIWVTTAKQHHRYGFSWPKFDVSSTQLRWRNDEKTGEKTAEVETAHKKIIYFLFWPFCISNSALNQPPTNLHQITCARCIDVDGDIWIIMLDFMAVYCRLRSADKCQNKTTEYINAVRITWQWTRCKFTSQYSKSDTNSHSDFHSLHPAQLYASGFTSQLYPNHSSSNSKKCRRGTIENRC